MSVVQTILERLDFLENEVRRLSSEKTESETANEFERLPATATVGKEYVAYRFGCSLEAVRRERAGTHRLTPYRVSPKRLLWIKKDVDEVFRERSKSKTEKALDAIRRASSTKRRRSIIKI